MIEIAMNKYIKYILGIVCLSGVLFASCDDIDDVVTSVKLDRLFSPTKVEAAVTNSTKLNLFWAEVKGAEGYVVEIYTDSLVFTPDNLAAKIDADTTTTVYELEGDMWYTARVKAVAASTGDSKWSDVTFRTGIADFFLASQRGDIQSTSLTMRWAPNTKATKISFKPGEDASVSHTLTEQELAAGVYTMEGLESYVTYTVTLYDGDRKVSVRSAVTTLIEGATIVGPNDNLLQLIEQADGGAAFMLEPGVYFEAGQKVTLSKNIILIAADENDKPLLHAQFDINGATNVSLKNLLLDGTGVAPAVPTGYFEYVVQVSGNGNYDAITLDGCEIANYDKSILYAASAVTFTLNSFIINNCFISNINAKVADGIDVRDGGLIRNTSLTNSTFANVAQRDFIRFDNASAKHPSQTAKVNIANCTFYKVANGGSKGFLYLRFVTNQSTVENCIFSDMTGVYCSVSDTNTPTFNKNNYFKAEGFHTTAKVFDNSGTHTTLNPEFVDAEAGDFRVQNIPLANVGDPRWRQ